MEGNRGYRVTDSTTATRTDTPIRDIPANVQVIPRQLIEDQGAIRLSDVLRNVSGVSFGQDFGGQGAEFNARGFRLNEYRNGFQEADLFGSLTDFETAGIERIEVVKGPGSVLFGSADPAGTINIITKRPTLTPYAAVNLTFGSYDLYRPTLDVSGPLTPDGALAYRLNIAYENSRSYRDFVRKERAFIAPVLTWKPGPDTTITFEGEFLRYVRPIDRGLVAQGDGVVPVPVSRFLGDPNAPNISEEWRGYLYFDQRLAENLNWRSVFRAGATRAFYRSIESDTLLADNRTLTLFGGVSQQNQELYTFRNELVWKFATGSIRHTLLAGFEFIRGYGWFGNDRPFAGNLSIDIFNPVYQFNYAVPSPSALNYDGYLNTFGVYLQDQITVADNLKVLLSGRFDNFSYGDRYNDPSFNTVAVARDFSPRVGIVYQPIPEISLYANTGRSFAPQFGLNATGTPFLPERGTNYEAGLKAEFLGGRLATTLSVYRIEKDNVLTADPSDFRFSIQVGQQQSSGFEFDIVGEILRGWNVIASYAYTDARITRDNTFPVGNRLPRVPYNTASLWTTYRIPEGPLRGLGFGAGAFFVDNRSGDLDNTFEVPGYTRVDAAVYYNFGNIKTAVNLKNLLDVRYFEGVQARRNVPPGAPLTVQGTLSLEF
ncbi:TonB-dependent siderophore receptor [Gloeobacter morelensis]|uniref:TonB-dependent siderophore receptor n=1 Tax=Gloeobacter morelensis TaxID=2907343 RepID=UPI001E3B8DE1|nr:TonB-dependent siderophore receptor [Gloeobacter morelensis]